MKKKIEEMARDLFDCLEYDEYSAREYGETEVDTDATARNLYKQGYQKQEQGEWKEQNDGTHYCSNCGHDATQNYEGREICGIACAYCGAKMKGE